VATQETMVSAVHIRVGHLLKEGSFVCKKRLTLKVLRVILLIGQLLEYVFDMSHGGDHVDHESAKDRR
jgi:hypothetical protein